MKAWWMYTCFGSSQHLARCSKVATMGDPVQEQEMAFWDLWKKSQGTVAMEADTAPSTEASQTDTAPHPEKPGHKYQ